ncbi:helix-turn-helix domain-containing protein [Blautia schinkii]|nr:helix-turn-helix domain-containing protein [Blautia schinkii]
MADLLRKLEILWGQPIFYTSGQNQPLKGYGSFPEEESPFFCCRNLTDMLLDRAEKQQEPVVYKDENRVYFCCLKSHNGYYLTGPACTEELNRVEIHRYYKQYTIKSKEERHPAKTSLLKLLNFAGFLWELLEGREIDVEALMKINNLAEDKQELTHKEAAIMEMNQLDDEVYHHTYQEERYVMDCVREGDTAHVLERMDSLLENAGILSGKKLNHQRNLAIVIITIATREAIAEGISPAEAYRLSDLYINQIDECTKIEEIVECMRRAMYEFTKLVAKYNGSHKKYSIYTEQCLYYINENYHHKIHVDDISDSIGVSKGYLSRIFHRDTGISIQDYIQKIRVEKAANLLKYSQASLSQISDYVCFHSQSHFGSVFKKYMHMTPKQYRDRYKQKEFMPKPGPVPK